MHNRAGHGLRERLTLTTLLYDIARFAGSITINGVTYIVATHEEGQPLVRQDVLAAEAKKKERRNEQHTTTRGIKP